MGKDLSAFKEKFCNLVCSDTAGETARHCRW